jgi:hypothetical protein
MGTPTVSSPGVCGRKSVLVRLAALEKPVLGHGVTRRLLDGVRKQHEANVVAVPSRVPTGLVVRFHASEADPAQARGNRQAKEAP